MNPRVLLADDSSTMRKIIVRLLDEVGVESPTEAADGAEAVSRFEVGKFDLVLTDWNMPNKSGLEVVREIRAFGSNPAYHYDHHRGRKRAHLPSHRSRRLGLHRQAF